jgi:hypothetical protein
MDNTPVEKKPVAPAKKKVAAKKVIPPVYEPNIRIGALITGLLGISYVAVLQTELFVIPEIVTSLIDNDLFIISAALFLVSLFSIKTKK